MTMKSAGPTLKLNGYTDLPPGKIAAVVTYLEMRRRPRLKERQNAGWILERLPEDLARYRSLFRRVGSPWLWFSRLVMSDAALAAIISHPAVETYALRDASGDIGLLELSFRSPGTCELAFLGVVPEAIGTGAGRHLMNAAIRLAFRKGIEGLFVHTCSLDHPAALPFYLRTGFIPYKRAIEVADDPRLAGPLPLASAPQVPVIPIKRRRVIVRPHPRWQERWPHEGRRGGS